jgi:tight adherence protein C
MTDLLIMLWGCLALGVWLVVQRVPTPTPPRLPDRVLPYLGRPQLRAMTAVQAPAASSWRATAIGRGARLSARLGRLSGGEASVRRRLETLGSPLTVEQYRFEQLLWGAGAATVVALLLLRRGVDASQAGPTLVVLVISAILGILARDRALTRSVTRRNERLRAELPTMVEMLAMSVSAGSGLLGALDRLSQIGSGVLSNELKRVLSDVRVGQPLVPALHRMADRNELVELRRLVDAITVSMERGTPMADVLVAQAGDVREAERRALIESGGRKEIAMMVPIVFLVLPLSVLFVLFPGFYGLQLGS